MAVSSAWRLALAIAAAPSDAPCTQYLRHGDPIHARKALTAAAAIAAAAATAGKDDPVAGGHLIEGPWNSRAPMTDQPLANGEHEAPE
eukprot:COSAG01_NODE_18284_length_1086_cov_57.808511_1_plen_88_part_00